MCALKCVLKLNLPAMTCVLIMVTPCLHLINVPFHVAQNASSSSDKFFFLRAYTSSDTACVLITVMCVYFSLAQTASLSNEESVEDSTTDKVGVLYFCCS